MESRSVAESYRLGRLGIDDGTIGSAWGIAERERRMRTPPPRAPRHEVEKDSGLGPVCALTGFLWALTLPDPAGLLLLPAIGYVLGWLVSD